MKQPGDWRYVYASVPGVTHRASGAECQDACAVRQMEVPDGTSALVLAAADGAGSAAEARAGAELACQTLLAECAAWLAQPPGAEWTRAVAETLIERIQTALSQRATETGSPVREFACTLLGAVLADDRALFLQIGDGAIVLGTGDDYWPVFWPQAGEYANETYFATDAGAAARLEFAATVEPVAEIALLTDGLQTLALHYQTRQAHAPFFRPLFQRLRAASEPGCPTDLQTALERFLDAPALNQRTHDDKTLILATRLSPMTAEAVIAPAPAEPAVSADPVPADVPARPPPTPPAVQEASGDEAV